MARNAAVRNVTGSGNWIGKTDIWNDPRAQLATSPVPTQVAAHVTAPVALATEKQLAFLKSLFAAQKGNEVADALRGGLLALYKNGTLTRKIASDGIAALLANR